jgi:hypothetical protein
MTMNRGDTASDTASLSTVPKVPVGLFLSVLKWLGVRALRKWRAPKLLISDFGDREPYAVSRGEFRVIRTALTLRNGGRTPARDWRVEVRIPATGKTRADFPGEGLRREGDDYVMDWSGELIDVGREQKLKAFEVDLFPDEEVVARYKISATEMPTKRGTYKVTQQGVEVPER